MACEITKHICSDCKNGFEIKSDVVFQKGIKEPMFFQQTSDNCPVCGSWVTVQRKG